MMWFIGLSLVALVSATKWTSSATYNFGGQFRGQCGADGIYYRDATSFMVCVDGVATIQQCAPGSQNVGSSSFQFGSQYGRADFCSLNLVNTGYDTRNNNGYGNQGNSANKVYSTNIGGNSGYGSRNQKTHGNGYGTEANKVPARPQGYGSSNAGYGNTNRADSQSKGYGSGNQNSGLQGYGGYSAPVNTYQGRYNGRCVQDGIYYNDESSFVLCSGGASTYQPCAPGSRSQGFGSFQLGGSYGLNEFCGVNLVDTGYGANTGGYGSAPSGYGSNKQQGSRSNVYEKNNPVAKPQGYGNPIRVAQDYDNKHQVAPTRGYGNLKQVDPPKGYGSTNGQGSYPRQSNDGPSSYAHESPNGYGGSQNGQAYRPHGNGYGSMQAANAFRGQFTGRCFQDGVYYNDQRSFVLCSGGAPFYQPCAPGTRSQGIGSELCGLNLVNFGSSKQQGYGTVDNKNVYK